MADYRNPKPTVDVIIEHDGGVVLIRRANPPAGWAIPGGFVDEGEPVEAAALREMEEETSLQVRLDDLLYVYSDPRRDPRHHTLTTVFIGHVVAGSLGAGDDAADAQVFSPRELPDEMAFDHRDVIADYVAFRETGKRPDPMERLEQWRSRSN